LLVFDEVQTGIGRSGSPFFYQGEDVVPDVLVLAKSLSGGFVPAAATLTSREIAERAYGRNDRFDLHGSTFSGMALACAAIVETLAIMKDERLAERAAAQGDKLVARLRAGLSGHPLVQDVRGQGLLIGIALGAPRSSFLQKLAAPLVETLSEKLFGQWIAVKLLEAGVVCQPSSHDWDVLKIEPPLVIADAEVETLAEKVIGVLQDHTSPTRIIASAVKRIDEQRRKQWSFR
jgi:acetylornithine/succinyldiaminopimelate/putrescine aminotransferase